MKKQLLTAILLIASVCFNITNAQVTSGFTFTDPCNNESTHFHDVSTTTNNFIDSLWWDFGDPSSGAANTVQNNSNPSHFFDTAGTYMVTLIAKDDVGAIDTYTFPVVIYNSPAASFVATSPCFGDTLFFTNTSTTDSGTIVSSNWGLGDATSDSSMNPAKWYASANEYNVTLTVTASTTCSSVFVKKVKVNAFPLIGINGDLNACSGQPENLFDITTVSLGSVKSRLWEYSSSMTDTNQNISLTFDSAGYYPVMLTVTSDSGCVSKDTIMIQVSNLPLASFQFTPTFGDAPLYVTFQNTSPDLSNTFSWVFDDGSLSAEQNPVHQFQDTGTYQICLTAQNLTGCLSTPNCSELKVRSPITDLAVQRIYHTVQTGKLSLSVRIANFGNIDITSANLTVDLGGNFSVTENFTDTIKPGKEAVYVFKSAYNVNTTSKELFACVSSDVLSSKDTKPENDRQCVSISGLFYMSEINPNPVKDEFRIDLILPEAGAYQVQIYDVLGKKAVYDKEESGKAGLNNFYYDVRKLGNGVFVCRATYEGKTITRQFVKY